MLDRDVIWEKTSYTDLKPVVKTFAGQGSGFRIYLKNLIPSTKQSLAWFKEEDLKLPPKHYSHPQDLCAQLNRGDKAKFNYEFGYNTTTHKFHVYVRDDTVVYLSPTLSKRLGFDKQRFYRENTIATRPSLIASHVHHFYVYSNFIAPTQVGGKPVPLLKYIPLETGEYGATMFTEFLNKSYVPVNVSRLQNCEFGIYDNRQTC